MRERKTYFSHPVNLPVNFLCFSFHDKVLICQVPKLFMNTKYMIMDAVHLERWSPKPKQVAGREQLD